MLIIQYGMQGSASSWVFNLCQRIAENMGSDQKKILNTLDLGPVPWSGIKDDPLSKPHPNPWDIHKALLKLTKEDVFVMKTHSAPPASLHSEMVQGRIRAILTSRDPIDCAASVYNKGKVARERNTKPFSHITTFEQAFQVARGDVLKAERWRKFPNILELPYKIIRLEPEACARLCASVMEYSGPMDVILEGIENKPSNFAKGLEGQGYDLIDKHDLENFIS